jgi:hypothetical protein
VQLPDGLIAKPHTAHGYDSGSIARGWIGEAPVTVIVQTFTLDVGFNEWVRRIGRFWLEHRTQRFTVPGAGDSVRIDGFIEFDGLGSEDDRERCTVVCAKRGRLGFSLTIRSRPEDRVHELLESIVESFSVHS